LQLFQPECTRRFSLAGCKDTSSNTTRASEIFTLIYLFSGNRRMYVRTQNVVRKTWSKRWLTKELMEAYCKKYA
jgi:hypothetical protein